MAAELIGSDASWGNTEGPAVDSKGVLYFTSRGTFKGIVSWTEAAGASQYLAVATGAGPGGLWIDANDNIYLTGTRERQILKVAPDKKVSVVAEKFEGNPEVSTGPNDIVVASDGAVYFTAPNGYDGSAPNGTVYRTSADGKTSMFSGEITGPNGIVLSSDEKTLYVSHNTAPTTAKIVTWPINADGTAGPIQELITVPDCIADGMAVDQQGNVWLTCYSFGTAHLVSPQGTILQTITTEQKALTNAVFGRGADNHTLYLTSSDMERVTGYVYRAKVEIPGLR
jgi:gluconolactonase